MDGDDGDGGVEAEGGRYSAALAECLRSRAVKGRRFGAQVRSHRCPGNAFVECQLPPTSPYTTLSPSHHLPHLLARKKALCSAA